MSGELGGEREKGACYIGEGQNGSNCTPYCSHAALALCSMLYAGNMNLETLPQVH